MGLLTVAIVLTVASNVLYHIAQKSIPGGAHPLTSLIVTYLAALLVTLLLWPLYPGGGPTWQSFSKLNWASLAVGVAIVGVEMGVLLAYRAGWRVGVLSTVVNVALVIVLLPIGLLFFGEHFSIANAAGLVLCVAGLWLLI
jgi:drug/metabolite transporter (DMT)-like permease